MTAPDFVLRTLAAPSGPDKILAPREWVPLPDLATTLVTYAKSNLSITVSGEVGGHRVFLRALIDGRPARPADVLFTAESFRGIRSFTFVQEDVDPGLHTVEIEWLEDDPAGRGSIGDRTLTVVALPATAEGGGLKVVAARSGPRVSTQSPGWMDMPDLRSQIRTGTVTDLAITVAGEAGGGRMFVRALIDGQVAAPSDVLFATEDIRGTRSFNFTRDALPPGTHDVRIQWHEDGGGTSAIGDRTLTLLARPSRDAGGGVSVKAAPSGPDVTTTDGAWRQVPNLTGRLSTQTPCDLALTVSGEAGGGRMFVRALVDGQPTEPSDVLFTKESFRGIRSFTFSRPDLPPGNHDVEIQWHEDGGGISTIGDRTLTLAYAPNQPDLVQPYHRLQLRRGKRRVVVILWDPQRPGVPAPARATVETAFEGAVGSVHQYFHEASLGQFDFDIAAFLPPISAGGTGWYTANRPAAHYWGPADPTDQDGDGFTSGHTEKWAEAVWKAAADFDFNFQDRNGTGTLDPDELLVCILIPQNGAAGFQRTPAGQQYPTWKPLRARGREAGVRVPTILEIYLGNPPHVGLMFHEFAHLLLDAADMYHGWPPESEYVPFTIGPYSLMATGMPANLDPFHRLKYGWLRHRFAHRAGPQSLEAAVPHGDALILMDPGHSSREYFLVENRWDAAGTCDASLPDRGLAVWHIIEDRAVYNAFVVPQGTDPGYWASTLNQWSRRGVRLIRPVVAPPPTIVNNQALWDGSQAATGYDLLSADPNPDHAELRWANGAPSGFALRNIGAAAATMAFDLEVPW